MDKEHLILYTHDAFSTDNHVGIYFTAKKSTPGYFFGIVPASNKFHKLESFGTNIRPENWNNFVFTYLGSLGLCAYINGDKVACDSAVYSTTATTTATRFKIGYKWDSAARTEMLVDDFAVWKTVLSENEIKQMYKDGSK